MQYVYTYTIVPVYWACPQTYDAAFSAGCGSTLCQAQPLTFTSFCQWPGSRLHSAVLQTKTCHSAGSGIFCYLNQLSRPTDLWTCPSAWIGRCDDDSWFGPTASLRAFYVLWYSMHVLAQRELYSWQVPDPRRSHTGALFNLKTPDLFVDPFSSYHRQSCALLPALLLPCNST